MELSTALTDDARDEVTIQELKDAYDMTLNDQVDLQGMKDRDEFPEWKQPDFDHNEKILESLVTVIRHFSTQARFLEMFDKPEETNDD